MARCESRSSTIGHITLGARQSRAGAGNAVWPDASLRKSKRILSVPPILPIVMPSAHLKRWSFPGTGNEGKAEAVPLQQDDESVDGDSICYVFGGNRVFGSTDLHCARSRRELFTEREFVARWIAASRNRPPFCPSAEFSRICPCDHSRWDICHGKRIWACESR